eukprot:tig00020592_g11682.t1
MESEREEALAERRQTPQPSESLAAIAEQPKPSSSRAVSRRAKTEAQPAPTPKHRILQLAQIALRLPTRRHSFAALPRPSEPSEGSVSFLDELRAVFYAPRAPGDSEGVEDWNEELHSDAALLRRESLRFDPDVCRMLLRFHGVVSSELASIPAPGTGASGAKVRFELYKKWHFCIYRALHEKWDPAEAMRIAVQDWELDSAGHRSLSKARFMRSVFEIVDTWTATVNKTMYLSFLRSLFKAITRFDKGRNAHVLREVEEVQVGGEATAIGDWMSRSQRARRRFALRMARAQRLRPDPGGGGGGGIGPLVRGGKPPRLPLDGGRPGDLPVLPGYRFVLLRRRLALDVAGRRPRPPRRPRSGPLAGPPYYASASLYGWPLIQALHRMGPGFARRLTDGGYSAAIARCAQQVLDERSAARAGGDSVRGTSSSVRGTGGGTRSGRSSRSPSFTRVPLAPATVILNPFSAPAASASAPAIPSGSPAAALPPRPAPLPPPGPPPPSSYNAADSLRAAAGALAAAFRGSAPATPPAVARAAPRAPRAAAGMPPLPSRARWRLCRPSPRSRSRSRCRCCRRPPARRRPRPPPPRAQTRRVPSLRSVPLVVPGMRAAAPAPAAALKTQLFSLQLPRVGDAPLRPLS